MWSFGIVETFNIFKYGKVQRKERKKKEKKIFTSEEGKEKRVGSWIETKYVQDDVFEILLYNEQVDKYIADFGTLFFE